jgi:hypothetical protein
MVAGNVALRGIGADQGQGVAKNINKKTKKKKK